MFNGVVFVSELPTIEEKGGVVTFYFASGECRRAQALPIWLVRIVHARVGEIIATHDGKKLAA